MYVSEAAQMATCRSDTMWDAGNKPMGFRAQSVSVFVYVTASNASVCTVALKHLFGTDLPPCHAMVPFLLDQHTNGCACNSRSEALRCIMHAGRQRTDLIKDLNTVGGLTSVAWAALVGSATYVCLVFTSCPTD